MGGFNTSVAPPSPAALDLKPPVSESPLQMLAQMQEMKLRGQQMQNSAAALQTHQLEQQKMQLDLDQRKAINQAYQDAFVVQPDGSRTLDENKLSGAMVKYGAGEYVTPTLEGLTKYKQSIANLHETNLKVQSAEQDAAGSLAATVQAANNDPNVFHAALQLAVERKILPAEHLVPMLQAVEQAYAEDPSGGKARQMVAQFTTQMKAGSAKQQELDNARRNADAAQSRATSAATQADNSTTKLNAEMPGIKAESELKAASAAGLKSMTDEDWQKAINDTIKDHSLPLYDRTVSEVALARKLGDLKRAQDAIKNAGNELGRTETAVATAKATAPIRIENRMAGAAATQQASGMTEDDYKRSGEEYARTGVMPAIGRDSLSRGKIVHASHQWERESGLSPADVVTMRAAYAGNKKSLIEFQAKRDQIVSLEETANKNLDLLITQGQKIVDSGSPWVNSPLRTVDSKLFGSGDLAAYKAARQVAVNEAAKVTQGGGIGGPLSDASRKEIGDFIPQDASLKEMISVARVLKKDMANRRASMDNGLADITARIGGGGNTATPQKATHRFNPTTGKVEELP